MPYQVTMDSNLSDEDLDRLQISNYNRRKWNTKFATESDSEYTSEIETPSGTARPLSWPRSILSIIVSSDVFI